MAKIKLKDQILDAEDKPLPDGSLRTALMRALAADNDENGNPIRGEDKLSRYDLWQKVKTCQGDILEVTPEELVVLRRVVLAFPTLIAGQCHALLTG